MLLVLPFFPPLRCPLVLQFAARKKPKAGMEELATAPPSSRHRARRHRRKALDSATYGDVFGGGPRFAAPLAAGVPGDYSDVFGGVAASCSIPYLDLPPAAAAGAGDAAGRYGEIFTRFDFGEVAAPYEDVWWDNAIGLSSYDISMFWVQFFCRKVAPYR